MGGGIIVYAHKQYAVACDSYVVFLTQVACGVISGGGQLHGRFVEGSRSLWVLYVALGGVLLLAERATARLVDTLRQEKEA